MRSVETVADVQNRMARLHVAHMIAELLIEDGLAPIVGIEIKVKRIHDIGTFVIHYNAARYCTTGLSLRVWSDTLQPCRVLSEVIVGGEVDILLSAVVQGVQIVQSQR